MSPGWWMDADDDVAEDGLTLPQPLWETMERLHCPEDVFGLSSRLEYGRQLANTMSSTVFEATLDGTLPVVVKVKLSHSFEII